VELRESARRGEESRILAEQRLRQLQDEQVHGRPSHLNSTVKNFKCHSAALVSE
jgi:hypothetical protein